MVDSDSEALPGVSERGTEIREGGGRKTLQASTARRAQFALQCPVFTYLMQQNKAADDCQVFRGNMPSLSHQGPTGLSEVNYSSLSQKITTRNTIIHQFRQYNKKWETAWNRVCADEAQGCRGEEGY